MSSRHSYFQTGTIGRLSSATFDQRGPSDPTRQNCPPPLCHLPSPQSGSSNSPPTTPHYTTPPQNSSLLDRHAISNYSAKKIQLPLSVYELPTATYMWPRWNPREEEQPSRDPVIFVKYRPANCDADCSSGYSRPPSRTSILTSSSHPSPLSTPPPTSYSRKRSSSADSDNESAPSPSDRFIKHPRFSHNNAPRRVISDRSASPSVLPTLPRYQYRTEYKEQLNASRGLDADYRDVEMVARRSNTSAHQSNSTRGGAVLVSTAPSAVPALAGPPADREEHPMKNEWQKYTDPPPETTAVPEYWCTWEVKLRDGTTQRCGYHSKKHLVKRHIESKHLQLRPCICHFCGKGFSQKSNLETHLNTHTGEAPHKCLYCDERFRDPARKHRHMCHHHHHQSSRSKKDRVMTDGGTASSVEASDPDA